MKKLLVVLFTLGVATGLASQSDEPNVMDHVSPFASYGHVYDGDNFESMRPRVMGSRGVLATGHYLATLAGIESLRQGGNAFDAGVTAAMALKVTKMGLAGWNGVAPLVLYSASEDAVVTRVGAGTAPANATLEYFQKHGKNPFNTALMPADVDVWLATLDRFGTISFTEAVEPALEIAEEGYHLYKMQKWLLTFLGEEVKKYPYNVKFWFQRGVGNERVGDLMVNRDLGRLMKLMMDAEKKALARGGDRSTGIRAARDAFYKGDAARAAAKFYAEHNGILTYDDLAGYEGKWMDPLHTTFMGYGVYACDGWSQGPRLILMLNMLEAFDLESLGYNTADYIHVLSQVINLAMADSYKYVGDPDFNDTPADLYSKAYGRERAKLIDMKKAFKDMPAWGDPGSMEGRATDSPRSFAGGAGEAMPVLDTSSLNVMDGDGNVFSMTESDGHMMTPMVPGWGFGLSNRMGQFDIDPELANVVAPGKRPRNTNAPFLIMKDAKPFMGLSTPGGDQQVQSLLQVLLNVVLWGMSPEQALDQPRFGSYNFPATGTDKNKHPGVLKLESRIPDYTAEALRRRGHDVQSWGRWNWLACSPTVTYRDPETGVLIAAGDVRRETSAMGF